MAHNIPLLPEGCLQFPDPHQAIAEHDGLVAVSRDLTAQRLLAAYQQGIFPWFEEDGLFFWFATAPRTVLVGMHGSGKSQLSTVVAARCEAGAGICPEMGREVWIDVI